MKSDLKKKIDDDLNSLGFENIEEHKENPGCMSCNWYQLRSEIHQKGEE